MSLTAKEEHFSTLIALEDATQHDALLQAYKPRRQLSNGTIDQMASRIANRVKVKSRIESLRSEVRLASIRPAIADIVERKEHATGVMRDKGASRRDQLAANKLGGEYERDFVTQVETRGVVLHATLESLEPEKRAELIEVLQAMKEKGEEE